jgi:hypothetical protein
MRVLPSVMKVRGHGLPNGIPNAVNGTVCVQFEKEKYVARLSLNINIS